MSWNEYHEMRFFVNRSIKFSCWNLLFISWFARWKFEHDRWIDEFDWLKINWDYRTSLLDLKKTMRWLHVKYSYSKRKRNMISFFKDYCLNNYTMNSLNLKNIFLLNFFFEWIARLIFRNFFWLWIFWFNHLKWRRRFVFAFETKRHREDHDCHSRMWMFFFMRKIIRFSCEKCLFFALLIVKMIISIDSKFKSNSLCDFFWNSSKAIIFHEWKML